MSEPATPEMKIPTPLGAAASKPASAPAPAKAAAPTKQATASPKVTEVAPVKDMKTARTAKFRTVHGFPIRHFNGGVTFYPGQDSAEVAVDQWIENQVKKGILKEV